MNLFRKVARALVPHQGRSWLRELICRRSSIFEESRNYGRISQLGSDSSNIWIRRSSEIGGWLFEGEHEFLWELAKRNKAGDILEIGTWMGKSTCILAGACLEHAPDSRVVTIDSFRMSGTDTQMEYHHRLVGGNDGTFYHFIKNAHRHGFSEIVVPIAAYSLNAIPLLRGPFRMVFVDGTHDRKNCSRDVEISLPLLSQSGILAIHDAAGGGWPEVEEYVQDLLNTDNTLRHLETRGTIVAFEKTVHKGL